MAGVIYALNGVPLHNEAQGWRTLRASTNTQGGITNALNKVSALGQNGYTPAPFTTGEQMVTFVVRTTRAGLEPLLALCGEAHTLTRVGDATKLALVQVNSAIPGGESVLDSYFTVTISLSLYQGVWRDADALVEGPINIVSPTQVLSGLFPGIGAPVQDMDVFIKGVFGQFQLTDSHGSWLKTTSAWAGSASTGILFIGSTSQAFLANESSPFTPVSDVSGQVDVSGNGGFKITPEMVSGNPSTRAAKLTLTTLSQTNVTLRVRAKRAYRMN